MKKRALGHSGLDVTIITFGCWQAGGSGWTDTDDATSLEAMHAAYEVGINFFDTAEGYGNGHSETLLGQFLNDVNDESIFVASKVGAGNLAADKVRSSCEASLKRLGREKIDLYQIHWPAGTWGTPIVPIEETMGALVELQNESKIGAIGVSNFQSGEVAVASRFGRIESLQPPYSLFFQPYVQDYTVNYCADSDIAILPYSPLAQGLVTGKFNLNNRPQDNRSGNILFQDPTYGLALEAVENLKPIAERYNANTGQIALAWLIAQATVTSPIVGARNSQQITEMSKAAEIELTQQDIDEIYKIAQPVLESQTTYQTNPWA